MMTDVRYITVTAMKNSVADMACAFAVPVPAYDFADLIATYQALIPAPFRTATQMLENGTFRRTLSGETADGRKIDLSFELNEDETYVHQVDMEAEARHEQFA